LKHYIFEIINKSLFSKLESNYLKNTFVVFIGNIINAILTFVLSAIITRLYSPANFGAYAVLLSVSTITATISTFRLENIFFLKTEFPIKLIIISILIISLTFNLILSFILISFSFFYILPSYYLYVPILSQLIAIYSCFRNYNSSAGFYKSLSILAIFKTIVFLLIAVFLGIIEKKEMGLIIAGIFSQFFESFTFVYLYFRQNKGESEISFIIQKIKLIIERYKGFPVYALPAELFNVLSNQGPTIILVYFFGEKYAGYFSLVQRMLGAPVKLFSGSIGEVFRREAMLKYNNNSNIRSLVLRTCLGLALIGAIPFTLLFYFSSDIISFLFGNEWIESKQYVEILLSYFYLQFCISPMSYILYILEKQKINLKWQILLFIFTISSLSIGGLLNNPRLSIILFSISYSLMYIIYLFIILYVIEKAKYSSS